jgi:fumarate reductase subunit D
MSSIAIKDVKFRLTIASYAFLVLALLALTHYVFIIAAEGLNLIPRSKDHPLVDILIPTWGHCGNIILRVLVLILGFTTYVTLFSAVSLGLSALTSPRYNVLLVLLFVLGIVIPAFNGLYSQSYSTLYYPVYTVPNVLLESGFRGLLYCMGLTIEWKNPLYQFYAELAFFALPQILLPIILLVTYMRVRRTPFLVPLIISIIPPIKILLILVLLLSPPDGAFLLFLLMIALAPVYGVLLWGSLAIAFLKLAKGRSL